MQIFFQFANKTNVFSFQSNDDLTIESLYSKLNLDKACIILTSNGKNLNCNDKLENYADCFIEGRVRVLGGKGGFGSLLKGQPAVKKQTKNFDACRDISGRRLRHVNQEKQMIEWQQRKEEEDKLVNQYNSKGKEDEIRQKLNQDKKDEIIKENKKFFKEDYQSRKSIEKSFKFLNKKRKLSKNIKAKEKNKENKEEKEIIVIKKENIIKREMTKEELLEAILD